MLKRRAVWGILYNVYARVGRSEMGEVKWERSIIKRIEKIFDIVSTCRNEKRTRQFIKPFGIKNSSKFDFFTQSLAYSKNLLYLCSDKGNEQRKEVDMQATIGANQYERMTVHVPRKEARKFRAVVKALGFEIEKKCSLDRALEDVEAGRVRSWSSAEEMFQALGI
jgi:hypothetical protein